MATKRAPVTPGELPLEELLRPMGISEYRLAKEIGVPAQRIGEIVSGRRTITADTRPAGRPIPADVQRLIVTMARANPTPGAEE